MFVNSKVVPQLTFQRLKVFYRCFAQNNETENVRVRFAPSPTGFLHLGGLRTALYNFLFAKSKKGKFLLRIEDTDQTRLVPGAAERLIQDLQWAGIEIDEGPGFGGQHGPYIQSERTRIYGQAVTQLLENGSAYQCFCTERRLELLRKEAARMRQIPRYDNKCRHLSKQQVEELLNKQTPYCIRFRLNEYLEPFHDLIYGNVQHNVADNEGDPVIMKSDNFPTYHFANVVDDHLMGITHVLRGVEWQISTTKHLLLYKAFNWNPPKFGHLPLLVNADGTKLSKRQGDIGIQYFRERGYYATALVNYVVTAGGGFMRTQHESQKLKIHSLPELANQFNINLVNSHPSRLNPELLDDLNRLQLQNSLQNKEASMRLVEDVRSLVKQAFPEEKNLDLSEQHIINVLQWSSNRLTFLKDLCTLQLSFLWVRPLNFTLQYITTAQLEVLINILKPLDFTKENLNTALRNFSKSENIKFANLMKSLRTALSGLKEGPGVAEMMHILGKNAVLQRLKAAYDSNNSMQNATTNVNTQEKSSALS